MIDSEYFRTNLQVDVDALGGSAVVELHLMSGRPHFLRSVLSIHSGYVTCEAYRDRGEQAPPRELRWKETAADGKPPAETCREVFSYESVVSVTIAAAAPAGTARIGFARS